MEVIYVNRQNKHRQMKREDRTQIKEKLKKTTRPLGNLSKPAWRCKMCVYLCIRDDPPEVYPICKAKKDRFKLFIS